MRLREVFFEVRVHVVTGNPPLPEKALEFTARHLGQDPCLAEREDAPAIEAQSELLEELAFHLLRRKPDSVDDFGWDL